MERRKREVKEILDKQMIERMAAQKRIEEERVKYESDLLNRCQEEIEKEKQKQAARRARMQEEKLAMEKLKADQQRDK